MSLRGDLPGTARQGRCVLSRHLRRTPVRRKCRREEQVPPRKDMTLFDLFSKPPHQLPQPKQNHKHKQDAPFKCEFNVHDHCDGCKE